MKRREFLGVSSKFVFLGLPTAALSISSIANASEEEAIITALESSEGENACQSIDDGGFHGALSHVNPNGAAGSLSRSVGCKSPHKHLLFVPIAYLENPALINQEADASENGELAKRFHTSPAFDMSTLVSLTVGAHQHEVLLTAADIEAIRSNPEGIKKIAYQKRFLRGGLEPGHVFQIKMPS